MIDLVNPDGKGLTDKGRKELAGLMGVIDFEDCFGVGDLLQVAALREHATDEDIKVVWSMLRKTYGYKKVNMVRAVKYGND